MRSLPEHSWLIEPRFDLCEKSIPYSDLDFKVVPRKPRKDIDLQIICLHLSNHYIKEILDTFHAPVVWIEYWETSYKPDLPGIYPMFTTSQSCHRQDYTDLRFTYFVPPKKLWNKPWIGNKKVIFCPSRQYTESYIVTKTLEQLKKEGIPLKTLKGKNRSLPFSKWQDYFIHSRALFEMTTKHSSGTLLEAMSIGMPVIAPPFFDNPFIIRKNIDGFIPNSVEETAKILKRLLDDYSFAKEMGNNARERMKIICSPKEFSKLWNQAFKDAIKVFNETGDWKKSF